jgi:hypothetical protein
MSPRFWGDLRSLAVPVLAYWAINLVSVGIFSVAIAVSIGPTPEALIALAIIFGATAFGVIFGQICGLLRLRMWAVLLAGTLTAGGLFGLTLATAAVPAVAGIVGLVWFFFPFCSLSGWLALQPNGAMCATFTPLLFITASIIFISERTGSVAYWFAGQKWAIWDIFTVPILFVSVAMVLVFLASREVHRLHHWQNADAPDLVRTRRTGSWIGGLFRSMGSVAVVGMLTVALTIGSALLAPYLWRTGPRDGDGDQAEQPQPDPQPGSEPQPQKGGKRRQQPQPQPDGEPIERGPGSPMSPEEMERAARQAGVSVLFLLLFALLALLSILVFGPPLRRTLFLTHLRRPLWPVPPTRHVQQSWWLVEVALGDLEVEMAPGDVPVALARKAIAKLPGALVVEPIVEVATVADRVAFGLGIAPDDTMRARRQAEMAYEAIWSQLTELQKILAIYRWI